MVLLNFQNIANTQMIKISYIDCLYMFSVSIYSDHSMSFKNVLSEQIAYMRQKEGTNRDLLGTTFSIDSFDKKVNSFNTLTDRNSI